MFSLTKHDEFPGTRGIRGTGFAHPRHPWHPWPLLGATGLSGDGAQPRAVEANACADPGDEFFAVLNSKSFHVFFLFRKL